MFVTTGGVPKILDFGIAKLHNMPLAEGSGGMGSLEGIPNDDNETYVTMMAAREAQSEPGRTCPRSSFEARTSICRADLWAVGIMMFKLFTGGKLPFGKPDPHV